jgi:hypothetical protein
MLEIADAVRAPELGLNAPRQALGVAQILPQLHDLG